MPGWSNATDPVFSSTAERSVFRTGSPAGCRELRCSALGVDLVDVCRAGRLADQ